MILQALNDYYERLAEDEESGIPLRGFSRQPVPFALEIDADGTLKQVLDLRVQDGKKMRARQLVVPGTPPPRSRAISATRSAPSGPEWRTRDSPRFWPF